MDKYVVISIRPFVLNQKIEIYNNGNVEIKEAPLANLGQVIYNICNTYNIQDVHLHGSKFMANKIESQFSSCKFGKNDIRFYIH